MGKGDKASGKLMVEILIENNTIGGNFIKYGFDLNIFIGNPNNKEGGWKQDFYDYLDRGDEKNVGTLKNTNRDWICNCLSYWLESLFSVSKPPRTYAIKNLL